MSGETQITVIGNLTGDPELRFIQSGATVVNFTVASTPRSFNKQTNEWQDGDTLFMRCALWREAAENVAESLTKGMRVVVVGNLVQRAFESNGEKRTVVEMQVEEVGPSLRYSTAKVTRVQRGQGGGFSGQRPAGPPTSNPPGSSAPAAQGSDPWASSNYSDEPPF